MDYTTRSYHSADCDPADCNYEIAEEYSSDFIVETDEESKNFANSPDELDYETSDEFAPEDEQAATTDDSDEYSYLDADKCDETDVNMYTLHTYDKPLNQCKNVGYSDNTESATDNVEEIGFDTDNAQTITDDETAATIDEWYTTDKPSARERCQLDDYEIISDVLGSEKQLVKLYSTALCEAAEEPFRNLIKENLDSTAADQYKAFEFMQSRGMYPTEQASEQDISEAKQTFTPLCRNNDDCGCSPCNCNTCDCD